MTMTAHPQSPGWTRNPEVAAILRAGVQRFSAIYPWSSPGVTFHPEYDLCFFMMTAAELLALHPAVPASMQPDCGHNDGPSWNECAELAAKYPELLFAGFLMPLSRVNEGVDLDAVYIPQPDPDERVYTQVITKLDGVMLVPDEDGIEQINGRSYRRLWWD